MGTEMFEPSYVKAPPLPAWCRGAGEPEYTSYLPGTGAHLRELASPTVRINDDLSLHLAQTEEWFCEDITHTPLRVMLWGRDGDLPFRLTSTEALALGLALIEHAGLLDTIEAQGAQSSSTPGHLSRGPRYPTCPSPILRGTVPWWRTYATANSGGCANPPWNANCHARADTAGTPAASRRCAGDLSAPCPAAGAAPDRSVVVGASADGLAHHPQHDEDESDDEQDDAAGGQDRDLGEDPDREQDHTEADHDGHLSRGRACDAGPGKGPG
jgi:hypothetical protein